AQPRPVGELDDRKKAPARIAPRGSALEPQLGAGREQLARDAVTLEHRHTVRLAYPGLSHADLVDLEVQVGMRIASRELDDGALERYRPLAVEVRWEAVVRDGRGRRAEEQQDDRVTRRHGRLRHGMATP